MKRLFDPDRFDIMLESINHNRKIAATYYIEDTLEDQDWIEHLNQVQHMTLEGSTSSWIRIKEDTGEVREKLSSKVLDYYEVPTKTSIRKQLHSIGFPD